MDSMNVLMLNYEYPPLGGGAANACYYMLREFAKMRDLSIDLVTSSANNKFEIQYLSDNIKIFKLNVKKKDIHYWKTSEIVRWTLGASRISKELIEDNDYNLCHCWFGWPGGIVGYLFRKKLPYIVALRGSDIPGYSKRLEIPDRLLFENLSKLIWKKAKLVTVLSRDSLNLARKACPEVDYLIIPNGIDLQEFHSKDKQLDEIGILYVGRFIERKGIRYLVEAFSDLLKKHDNIFLTLVGSGNTKEKIIDLCRRNGICHKVNIIGSKEHFELPDIYNYHDIFVLPSLNEGMSNVINEALASGLAIITTKTGAYDMLDQNCLTIEKESSQDIYKKLDYLISHPNLIIDMKKRSVEISKGLSWKACIDAYLELYVKSLTL